MAVDTHPSRRPSPPYQPPKTTTTAGTANKMPESASGQHGMEYGARHEIEVHGDATTMAHHFADHGGKIHPKSADRHMEGNTGGKVGRPGDEKANDEPG